MLGRDSAGTPAVGQKVTDEVAPGAAISMGPIHQVPPEMDSATRSLNHRIRQCLMLVRPRTEVSECAMRSKRAPVD